MKEVMTEEAILHIVPQSTDALTENTRRKGKKEEKGGRVGPSCTESWRMFATEYSQKERFKVESNKKEGRGVLVIPKWDNWQEKGIRTMFGRLCFQTA